MVGVSSRRSACSILARCSRVKSTPAAEVEKSRTTERTMPQAPMIDRIQPPITLWGFAQCLESTSQFGCLSLPRGLRDSNQRSVRVFAVRIKTQMTKSDTEQAIARELG